MKAQPLFSGLILLSLSGYAQASDLEGFNIALGLGYVQPKINYADNSGGAYQWDRRSVVPRVSATYNFAVNDKWLMGAGVEFDLDKVDAGTTSAMWGPVKASMSEHTSAYIQPAYSLDDTSTVFVKVGYHTVKVNTPPQPGANWIEDIFHATGIGYGIGYNKFINKNLFIQAEIQQVNYQSKGYSSYAYWQKTTSETVSIGYKF